MSTDSSRTLLGGDPQLGSRFLLEIDGVELGFFTEVSGLELTVGVEEYLEGGLNGFAHKLPGRISWPNLVFKRGLTDSDALFRWVNSTAGADAEAKSNKVTRHTGAVTVLDAELQRLRKWDFIGAYPVRWTGPRFSVDDSNALSEELEIAHHGFLTSTKPAS